MYKKFLLVLLFTTLSWSTSFKTVKFNGLTQISQNVAIEIANFQSNQSYTDKQINQAIKKFYDFGYFINITVSSYNNILTFDFIEKPFIVQLEMTGYKTRQDDLDSLFQTMDIKKGNMYSTKKIDTAKTKLLKQLEQEGYINSVVETETTKLSNDSIAVKFIVNKGNEVIIKKVNYLGAKALDISDFEDVTFNKEEDSFSWWFGRNSGVINFEQLKYDSLRIKEAYMQQGYLDAKVTPPFSKIDFNTNTATVDIQITEGKQYKINNIVIYVDKNIIDPKTIYPDLNLKKDKVANIKKIRNDIKYIKKQLANKGYAFVDIKYDMRQDNETNSVDIIYNILPGKKVYINDVIISGNSRTLDRVIRRNIYLAPNDLFNLTDFDDSKDALNRTGFFDSVKIIQEKVSDDKINLKVTVSEAPTGNLILGGGYGSYDGFMINASVNDKNIFGSGLNLSLSLDHSSKRNSGTLSLKNPAINDGIYNGSVSLYKTESTVTNDNNSTGDEITNTTGASIGAGRSLNRHTRVGATYAIENKKLTYEHNSSANSTTKVSAITPYISYNNTDSYFVPRKGIIAGSSLKYAGIGGDAKYLLSSNYFKYFHSLQNRYDLDWIIRYKTSLRFLKDNGDLNGNTFYLGGVSTIRGYQSYAIKPAYYGKSVFKKSWVNTVELSFPLIPSAKMRWALFYDYGMIGENSLSEVKKSGYGALISWFSPVGPIQFIFSRAINPTYIESEHSDKTSNFEFSLGSKF